MSTEEKRDFNLAAKIILGLTILSLAIGTITSFQEVSLYSKMGFGGSQTHRLMEAIMNLLMIGAAVMVFSKKRIGLIAFIALGLLRVFVTIPRGTDVSSAYYLGGNTMLFLRDVAPLAIALCFRKNGISGWKAFFASDDYVQEHYKENLPEDVVKDSPAVNKMILDNEVVKDVSEESQINQEQLASNNDNMSVPGIPQTKESGKKPFLLKWWHFVVGAGALLILFFLIIAIKPYPEYIEKFSEKWNYIFKKPNNSVVERLIEKADTYHVDLGLLLAGEKNTDVTYRACYGAYRDLDKILSSSPVPDVFVIKDTLRDISLINDNATYFLSWIDEGKVSNSYGRIEGSWLKERHERLDSLIPNNVKLITEPFDLKAGAKALREIYDITATIPVTDMDLFDDICGYYEDFNKDTQVEELYELNYKYNKNNVEFLTSSANFYYGHEKKDKAKEAAQRILSIDRKNSSGLTIMAEMYADDEKWDLAAESAKKAIDYDGEDPSPYFIYAEALFKKGEKTDARRQYNTASKKTEWVNSNARRLRDKYKEAGGCSFTIRSIDFAFKTFDGKIITNYGEKLYSSKSQFISPRISVKFDRGYENDEVQCKLYCRGQLNTGEDSAGGYTYVDNIHYYGLEGTEAKVELQSWGSSYSGNWPPGNYRFEVYFKDELIGSESFHLY